MSKNEQPMIPQEIIGFYKELVEIHSKFVENLNAIELTDEQKKIGMSQKAPLLSFVELEISGDQAVQVLDEICRAMVKHRPQVQEEVNKVQEALLEENFRLLLGKYIWQDENYIAAYAEERNIDPSISNFILFNVAKPFLISFARAMNGQFNPDLWQERLCPVCGWPPIYASTREKENSRILHCSLCETEWPFVSMKCPHCLSVDHEKLHYFSLEDDEVYRVNTCEECKGYIKTVDEEKLISKESPMLTDIRTLHLDMLAEREGFSKNVDIENRNKMQ